jgi:hypothetical protein
MKYYFLITLILLSSFASSEEIVVRPQVSSSRPILDGNYDSAWYECTSYTIKRLGFESSFELRTLINGGSIFFFLNWKDETKNKFHKPWKLYGPSETYIIGDEREDMLVFRWGITNNSANDVWMWGSVRANEGYADDLYEFVDRKPRQKSIRKVDFEGQLYYLQTQGDLGDRCWVTDFNSAGFWLEKNRYKSAKPSGSRADVRAIGVWKDKVWTVEIERKLNTMNYDDIEFHWGQLYYFDIAADLYSNAHIVNNILLIEDGLKPVEHSPLVLSMPVKPLTLPLPLTQEVPKEEPKLQEEPNEKN